MLLCASLTIRSPPLDHVNKLRHHCKVPASRRSDLIHIDRNVLFTSPEYALAEAISAWLIIDPCRQAISGGLR